MVFSDSFRLNSSLGLIFFVDIFETSRSRSLMEFKTSIKSSLSLSLSIKCWTILCLCKINFFSVDGSANHLFNNLPPIGEMVLSITSISDFPSIELG